MESVPYIIVSGLFQLIRVVLGLLVWAIIINAILSWLGGVDISPFIAILLIAYVFIRIIPRALESAVLPLLY